ncbi:MAG: alpha/beta fold hydrolase [Candidatus Aminicenantes bacterium]|nr:alpha/beta fold hydrolase [Candidatus Aminicenantes bacterium]
MKEKIFFTTKKGNRICGILSNPTSLKEKPIIILCHGFSTGKDGRTYVRLEEILNAEEISTFRFDFFGHGESEGKFEEITTSEAVDDVLNAIQFLKESGYIKIGLVGSSFGGLASIITASKIKSLYVLALKSPVSDYESMAVEWNNKYEIKIWEEKGFIDVNGVDGERRRLNYSFYEDAKRIYGYGAAKKIKIPTLIVHGDKDETVPIEQSQRTAGLIKNCRLETIKGGDHTYTKAEHFEKMLDLISRFIFEKS